MIKLLKQFFCNHNNTIAIYKNEKPSKNLAYIIKYDVIVCKDCKKRMLITEGRNPYKIIREA